MQGVRATASWLVGIHDFFEDINIVSATAAEHLKPLAPSRYSCHVTGGIWGIRNLCVYCCCIFAALMASVEVMSSLLDLIYTV